MSNQFDADHDHINPYAHKESADVAASDAAAKAANTGFILGFVGMIACLIPLIGFPVTVMGIVKSSNGLNSHNSSKAIAGLVLSITFLLVTIVNAAIGAYLGATGQLF